MEQDGKVYNEKLVQHLNDEIKRHKANACVLEAEVKRLHVINQVTPAAVAAKAINPDLVGMYVARHVEVETLDNGSRAVTVLDDIGYPRLDEKTGRRLTVGQFIDELSSAEDTAHLFDHEEYSAGSPNGAASNNPWRKGSINLTRQGQIYKENPPLARKLMEEAKEL